jgi:tetratricopeptide (TPR) repeat protein
MSGKNFIGARVDFSEAIKRDPEFLQAYENRGVAKFYLHDYKGAIDDYNKALEINPDDYSTFGRRGWAKFSLHDCTGAIADFNKSLEGNEGDALLLNGRGQAKYQLQDYQGALDDFNVVIRSWASGRYQKSKAYYWRGLIKVEMGQKESGCLDLKKAGKLGYAMAEEVMEMIFCK